MRGVRRDSSVRKKRSWERRVRERGHFREIDICLSLSHIKIIEIEMRENEQFRMKIDRK